MAQSYVQVMDLQGKTRAVFDTFRALSWGHKTNDAGFFTLTINGSDTKAVYLTKNMIVNIYRQPDHDARFYHDFSGLIVGVNYQWWDNGNSQIIASGIGMSGLLARRIIDYPSGTAQALKAGFCEDVMRQFVRENCGDLAHNPNRRSGDGRIAGLAVVDGSDYVGTYWTGDRSGENLLKVLQEIAQHSESLGLPLRFGVGFSLSPSPQFFFVVTGRAYNQDRSATNVSPVTGKNGSGNAPLIFSQTMGNVAELSEDSYGTEANSVVVIGSEDNGDVPFITMNAPDYVSDELNIGRMERQIDGREAITPAMLEVIGTEWLSELRQKDETDFKPIIKRGSMYGVDWLFGDIISYIKADGSVIERQISGVSIRYDAGGVETVEIELSALNSVRR